MVTSLDFTLLPRDEIFAGISILRGLPKEVEQGISTLPETLDRAKASVMFAESSSGSEEPWRNAAYLRAALGEFCSMEDVLRKELKLGQIGSECRIIGSKNPLLHLMKLLRNFNFHVSTSLVDRREKDVKWRDQPFSFPITIISNLSAEALLETNNGRCYSGNDVSSMVSWFYEAQRHWGAGYVVSLSVEAYCEEIRGNCLREGKPSGKGLNERPTLGLKRTPDGAA